MVSVNDLKNTKLKNIRIFFRFLKDNGVYYEFFDITSEIYKQITKTNTEYFFIKNIKLNNYQLIDFICETGIIGHLCNDDDKYDKWVNIDNKWLIYLYNNNLYGKRDLCSKRNLIDRINDIVEFYNIDTETTKIAEEILIKEKLRI